MKNSENKHLKEIIIGVFITVLGGFIVFLISQLFLIDYIYGILTFIIFILITIIIVFSYYLYKEKKVKKEVSKKKKPLIYGSKGQDRDEWLWER